MATAPNVTTITIARVFARHIWPYKWLTFFMVSSQMLGDVFFIFTPIMYKRFFDTLVASQGSIETYIPALVSILVAILLLYAGGWLMFRIAAFSYNYIQPNVMANLERTGFEYLLKHSSSFFANNFTGSLVRRVRRLSNAYEDLADNVQWHLLSLVITIAGSVIVIFSRSKTIALMTMAWVLVFIIANYLVARFKLKYDVEKAAKDSEVTGVLADAVSNNTNIKLFATLAHEKGLFIAVTEQFRKLRTLTWNIAEINDALQYALMTVIEFAVMYFAIKLYAKDELTIGDFALFQGYLIAIFSQIRGLGRIIRRIYESIADAREMVVILETPHDIVDLKSAKPLRITKGAIQCKGVTFRYRKTREVFRNFNLTIAPREKVALVGPSGSGKTTIVQLLLRMHDVQRGKVLIDRQDIARVTQDSLRSQIALVPQDPILFHRTLADNIRYGKLNASDKDVVRAAQQAHCDEFINALPDKYQTFVGERGIKLSGGERQRVAIARAILADTPILVLDEATSSLDSESESLIQDALKNLMQNKTAIVIAHRLSTILRMDRIVVMDKGEVVDTGTHKQLSTKKGLYRKLWEIQSEGFIE